MIPGPGQKEDTDSKTTGVLIAYWQDEVESIKRLFIIPDGRKGGKGDGQNDKI